MWITYYTPDGCTKPNKTVFSISGYLTDPMPESFANFGSTSVGSIPELTSLLLLGTGLGVLGLIAYRRKRK